MKAHHPRREKNGLQTQTARQGPGSAYKEMRFTQGENASTKCHSCNRKESARQ